MSYPVTHLSLVNALSAGPAVEVFLRAVVTVELVTEVRTVHTAVTHPVPLSGLPQGTNTAGLGDAGSGPVSLRGKSLAVEVVQETGGDVAVTGRHELVTECGARRDHLVIVTHGLNCLAQQLVRQRVTLRVHHRPDHVDDQVHLPHAGLAQHVGVGGDVVGQVGAVARL